MTTCEWCIDGKCVTKNEETCDWKNLPMNKEAIMTRMDEEREHIIKICKETQKTTEWHKIEKNLTQITDITQALEKMHTTLTQKYKTYKKIEDPIFATTLAKTIMHAKIQDFKNKRKPK